MQSRRIYPEKDGQIELSSGGYSEFGDFVNIMQVLEYVWLGNGERAKKLIEICGECSGNTAQVKIDSARLAFEDIKLHALGKSRDPVDKWYGKWYNMRKFEGEEQLCRHRQ